MINKADYTLVFDRKNKAKSSGKGTLEIVVYFTRNTRKHISTRINIKKEEWDAARSKVNSKNQNYIQINSYISSLIANIEAFEIELIQKGSSLTPQKINDFIRTGGARQSFYQYCHSQLDISDIEVSSFNSQKRSIEIFNEFMPGTQFADLEPELIDRFTIFMKGRNYSEGQKWKVHKDIRKFVNRAIRQNLIKPENNPYRFLKNTRPKGKHAYLSFKDIAAIEAADVSELQKLQLAKDMFLFACYTGLRYSDLFQLKGSDFEQRDEGLIIILERMYKVDRRVFLRLYDLFDAKPQNLILPYYNANKAAKYIWGAFISNSDLNLALKALQKTAGIKQSLTVHLARHTFGTLYAYQSGSIFDVMKAMGIAKFETAQIYINLSGEL